jgi:hypothetical protein
MWSLGMILHKMLFFKLPYRYATEGEASENDEADKMNKLEQEILGYSGYGLLTPACDPFMDKLTGSDRRLRL